MGQDAMMKRIRRRPSRLNGRHIDKAISKSGILIMSPVPREIVSRQTSLNDMSKLSWKNKNEEDDENEGEVTRKMSNE